MSANGKTKCVVPAHTKRSCNVDKPRRILRYVQSNPRMSARDSERYREAQAMLTHTPAFKYLIYFSVHLAATTTHTHTHSHTLGELSKSICTQEMRPHAHACTKPNSFTTAYRTSVCFVIFTALLLPSTPWLLHMPCWAWYAYDKRLHMTNDFSLHTCVYRQTHTHTHTHTRIHDSWCCSCCYAPYTSI